MSWQQFVLRLGTLNADKVEEIMRRHGALAVTFTDAADDPVLEPAPGATPMWRETRVSGLFPDGTDFSPLEADLCDTRNRDPGLRYRIERLEDRAWEREWLKDFAPMRFGERLWVVPTESDPPPAAGVVIRLDPGLAFGTGTHATTAMCLEQLERLFPPGGANEKRVLDFGCGSGILAIAALKLGAGYAVATDIDPQAVAATERNAKQNDVAERLQACLAGRAEPDGDYDVVVANILAQPLIDLAEALADRVAAGGTLILSGVLERQRDALIRTYDRRIRFDACVQRDGWVCLGGRRRSR